MLNRSELKTSGWNTRQQTVKLEQVLNRIKQIQLNIISLQETHLIKDDFNKVNKRWPEQVYCAFFTSYIRRIMILIRESIPFQLKNKYIDPSGQGGTLYLMVP